MTSLQNGPIRVRGTFQPPSIDEVERLRQLAKENTGVTLVLEGWKASRHLRTPFTAEEREELIRSALGADARKIKFVYAADDFYQVRQRVGHEEGHSSFGERELVWTDQTDIRDAFLRSGSVTGVPIENRAWLQDFSQTAAYKNLHHDRLAIDEYRASWSSAPYPPIFVTTDALVTKDDRVLMIRRGHAPGVGQLALPGGFLEVDEPIARGALRELKEETQFDVPGVDLRDRVAAVKVFDEPKRSARGRTITHVYHFALRETDAEPTFKAGDDAAEVFWLQTRDIEETEVFEDHYQIILAFGLL